MKKNQWCVSGPALAVLALTLGACASPRENAIFVTKTSLSVIDAESTPVNITLAYDRTEGYVGPRFDDGTVFPVVGYFETTGTGLNREVKQTYATGLAAKILTAKAIPDPLKCAVCARPSQMEKPPVMFFGTSTTLGLKLALQASSMVPESFTFGYKRKEVSIIPVDQERQPSVLASLDNTNTVSIVASGPAGGGQGGNTAAAGAAATTDGVAASSAQAPDRIVFSLAQFFATGVAAEQLALNDDLRNVFTARAKAAVGDIQKYRNTEAEQGRIALDTVACLAHVSDAALPRVWANADNLKVFGERGPFLLKKIRDTPVATDQRQIYMDSMTTLNADSTDYTTTLMLHREAVCMLGG